MTRRPTKLKHLRLTFNLWKKNASSFHRYPSAKLQDIVEFWGLPPLIPLLPYVNRLGFENSSVKQNKEAWLR